MTPAETVEGYAAYLEKFILIPSIGYFCSYAPQELIHAAGLHPVQIFPRADGRGSADRHIQAYACSVVRNAMSAGLAGMGPLAGVVFPHSCDSYQRLSDLWRINLQENFFSDIVFPARLDTPASITYIESILRRFKERLESFTKAAISDSSLNASIRLFNAIRARMASLHRQSIETGQPSPQEIFDLSRAVQVMRREDVIPYLDQYVFSEAPGNRAGRPALLITGSVCGGGEVTGILEKLGARHIGLDLCTGYRPFLGTIDEGGSDPIGALARFYASRKLCASKFHSLDDRWLEMEELINNDGIRGVIFLTMKFCEPYQFDYPWLREKLEKCNIPSLRLEIESPVRSIDQTATRIETFLELIS